MPAERPETRRPESTYLDWCRARDCDHAHCPNECEHPQPFVIADRLFCGRCYFEAQKLVDMLPCGPEMCGDERHD